MNDETIITFENASIQHKTKCVLTEVSFSIAKGELVYFIGRVGSGKTSMIKTMYAELPLITGVGRVAGFDLVNLKTQDIPFLRRKLGIIFQDFQLLTDRNVCANLRFVLEATGWQNKREMQEQIETVLQKVGLPEKKDAMPHQLSGGEQQRVAVARALLNNPEIILADEPTGNLDPETSTGIMTLFETLKNTGKTIVMATHNYNLIERFSGRIIKFENGNCIDTA